MTSSMEDLSFGSDAYKRIVRKSSGLPYTRYINRNLAWVFTRIFRGADPNAISIGAFCILFLAIPLALVSDSIVTSLAVYILLVLNYVLDSTDGQVSRLRGVGSPFGEWVDHSLDGVRILLIHSCLLLVAFRNSPSLAVACLFFCNIVFAGSTFFVTELAGKLLSPVKTSDSESSSGLRQLVRSLMLIPADHGVLIMMFLFVHRPDVLGPVYALYGAFWTVVFVGFFVTSYRRETLLRQ